MLRRCLWSNMWSKSPSWPGAASAAAACPEGLFFLFGFGVLYLWRSLNASHFCPSGVSFFSMPNQRIRPVKNTRVTPRPPPIQSRHGERNCGPASDSLRRGGNDQIPAGPLIFREISPAHHALQLTTGKLRGVFSSSSSEVSVTVMVDWTEGAVACTSLAFSEGWRAVDIGNVKFLKR